MWATVESTFSGIWNKLDDVFIAVIVIAIGFALSNALFYVTNRVLRVEPIVSKALKLGLQVTVVVLCLTQILGEGAMHALVGGWSIGIGYAFQPYIISIFNGLMANTEHVIVKDKRLRINNVEGVVEEVSLFTTKLKTSAGEDVFVPNSVFSSNIYKLS